MVPVLMVQRMALLLMVETVQLMMVQQSMILLVLLVEMMPLILLVQIPRVLMVQLMMDRQLLPLKTKRHMDSGKGPGKGKDPHADEVNGDGTGGGETVTDGTDTGDSNTGSGGDTITDDATGVVFGDKTGTDSLNPSPGDDPTIRLAQCAVKDPSYETIEDEEEDLISKEINVRL